MQTRQPSSLAWVRSSSAATTFSRHDRQKRYPLDTSHTVYGQTFLPISIVIHHTKARPYIYTQRPDHIYAHFMVCYNCHNFGMGLHRIPTRNNGHIFLTGLHHIPSHSYMNKCCCHQGGLVTFLLLVIADHTCNDLFRSVPK